MSKSNDMDMDDRRILEARLAQSEERMQLALAGADLGMWDWHILSGDFIPSERWCTMLGYTLDEIEPRFRTLKKMVHPDDWPGIRQKAEMQMRGEAPAYENEYRMRHKDGHWVWVLDRGKVVERDALGQPLRAVGTYFDISERKRARQAMEAELAAATRRLKELSQHLIEAQEDVRRRTAAELHDRTSPNLAAIKINLKIVAANLPPAVGELGERLDDTYALLEDTEASIREICAELRSSVLDYAGLGAAIDAHARNYARRTGIAVRVEGAQSRTRLAPALESLLFRIYQEALTNSLKHAHASSIAIGVDLDADPILLTISDDGVGFDPAGFAAGATPMGMGLLNMREMAEFAGGRLSIDARPGAGARIAVGIRADDARRHA